MKLSYGLYNLFFVEKVASHVTMVLNYRNFNSKIRSIKTKEFMRFFIDHKKKVFQRTRSLYNSKV